MKAFDDVIDKSARRALQDNRRIREAISRIVPASVLAHIEFCRIDDQVLCVTLDTGSSLARLRFQGRQIIDELSRAGFDVSSARWYVLPTHTMPAPARRTVAEHAMHPSTRAMNQVAATAASMSAGKLQDALNKLAKNMKPDSPSTKERLGSRTDD